MTKPDLRLPALRRFAVAISVLNLLGHTLLGFEQSWAQLFVPLFVAYATELTIEAVGARVQGQPRAWRGTGLVNFLLSAHITGLAVSMLLYMNDRLLPYVFAAAAAVASKTLLRVRTRRGERHFLNPSNTGIALTLLLFPWIGIAPPYQFTENVVGVWDWVIPCVIIASGTFLNARFTRRLPLIGTWMTIFALQAIGRSLARDTPVSAALAPMTGMAFLLFSFYMVSDPGTTPSLPRRQMLFGGAVGLTYCALQLCHVVFGLFFALFIVCCGRGGALLVMAWRQRERPPALGDDVATLPTAHSASGAGY